MATITRDRARRFYDRLGAHHDHAEAYESRAKARALALLRPGPGMRVLDVGCGTGLGHRRLVEAVGRDGLAVGVDLSSVMLRLTRSRTAAPVVMADVGRLPLRDASVDRVLSGYTLDLIASADLPGSLAELRRVTRPRGLVCVVGLTDGTGASSRAVMGVWRAVHRLSPLLVGGCRPLRVAPLLVAAGFLVLLREVVVQRGVASEIVLARR